MSKTWSQNHAADADSLRLSWKSPFWIASVESGGQRVATGRADLSLSPALGRETGPMLEPTPSAGPLSAEAHLISTSRAVPEDSAALLTLQHRLDRQSSFMLLEPGERPSSVEGLRARLAGQSSAGSFDLIAGLPGQHVGPVGWVSVEVPPYRRAAHVGHLVLGVDAACSGQGVGRRLLEAALDECRQRQLRRVELTVMVDNLRAVQLYLRCGFVVEGLRRASLIRDGGSVDEYAMAQLVIGSGSGSVVADK